MFAILVSIYGIIIAISCTHRLLSYSTSLSLLQVVAAYFVIPTDGKLSLPSCVTSCFDSRRRYIDCGVVTDLDYVCVVIYYKLYELG